ncbi:prepilin-type N-terminal cleavage/methylation domain-containing protein [uncultured Amnibacterium sp.]|uniref:type IV pilus modification PilV family protein n=1 Tax=uncultured Amnibacterium sp. TaxID=1631851 RepID=UPI0035CCA9BB
MRRPTGDAGFTLVETIVAMLVFALLSSGVIASTITISRMSSDNRARVVATNLAAQATDAVRLTADPFQVRDGSSTQTVSGRTYTVALKAAWVDSTGVDATCGAGTALQYKRITVTVTWAGQATTTQPVRTDTLLASTSKVTDADTGAILVSVVDSLGAGESGITAAITPGTGRTLTAQPAATDIDGCTYARSVSPGTYTVSLTAANRRDNHQVTAPTSTVSVGAGSTATATFQYDVEGRYTIKPASNAPAGAPPLLPTNLTSTLVPVGGTSTVWPVLVGGSATTASVWPVASGYSAVAGALTDAAGATLCASFDPGAWPARATAPALSAGARSAGMPAISGGQATVDEKMALVTVAASTAASLTAIPDNPVAAVTGGNPGCANTATGTPLTFGPVLKNGSITIALPYGRWKLSSSVNSALTSATPTTNPVGSAALVPATTVGGVKTVSLELDPRSAA